MGYKRKQRILRIIRRSALTGKAVWVEHTRTYKNEWDSYKYACRKEFVRMNQWTRTVARRRKNILLFLGKLTERLPIIGDIPHDKRDAAKVITQISDTEPAKQSDFYEHIQEEKRQKRNASRRMKRWREKTGTGFAK